MSRSCLSAANWRMVNKTSENAGGEIFDNFLIAYRSGKKEIRQKARFNDTEKLNSIQYSSDHLPSTCQD